VRQRLVVAAVDDHVDECRFIAAVHVDDVAHQVLNLRSLAGHATGLSGAGKTILVPQDAIDLLRNKAGEPIQAQGRHFEGLRLRGDKTAVGALSLEHGQHTGDAIACHTELVRLRFVVLVIIIGENAAYQHLAHRRVSELIVHPNGNPFRLRDSGDGSVG